MFCLDRKTLRTSVHTGFKVREIVIVCTVVEIVIVCTVRGVAIGCTVRDRVSVHSNRITDSVRSERNSDSAPSKMEMEKVHTMREIVIGFTVAQYRCDHLWRPFSSTHLTLQACSIVIDECARSASPWILVIGYHW